METANNASALFASGLNCAQAVLTAHSSGLGLDTVTALRLASGFGAGMGRQQEVCGAVSGAVLVLGLAAGYTEAMDKPGKERVYALTRELQRRFAEVHGSVVCRELVKVDLNTADGQAAFGTRNLGTEVCQQCVGTASRLVTELLEEKTHD